MPIKGGLDLCVYKKSELIKGGPKPSKKDKNGSWKLGYLFPLMH